MRLRPLSGWVWLPPIGQAGPSGGGPGRGSREGAREGAVSRLNKNNQWVTSRPPLSARINIALLYRLREVGEGASPPARRAREGRARALRSDRDGERPPRRDLPNSQQHNTTQQDRLGAVRVHTTTTTTAPLPREDLPSTGHREGEPGTAGADSATAAANISAANPLALRSIGLPQVSKAASRHLVVTWVLLAEDRCSGEAKCKTAIAISATEPARCVTQEVVTSAQVVRAVNVYLAVITSPKD